MRHSRALVRGSALLLLATVACLAFYGASDTTRAWCIDGLVNAAALVKECLAFVLIVVILAVMAIVQMFVFIGIVGWFFVSGVAMVFLVAKALMGSETEPDNCCV